ncbi:hypothetical protein [Modestobacter sp. SYSU DS0511]
MAASDRRTRGVEHAVIDLVEATVLAGPAGEVFDAVVLDAEERGPPRCSPSWPWRPLRRSVGPGGGSASGS